MKRVLAVCTVVVVLALLLGGLSSVDQIHSAVGTDVGVVYAAQGGTAPACPEIGTSTPGVVTEGIKCYIRCGPTRDGGFGCWIECIW